MKKLLLILTLLISFGAANSQNTLNINTNSLEIMNGGKSIWSMKVVQYVKRLNGIAYTVGNSLKSEDITYANISYVSVGGGTAVAPYSYDSLYNLINANIVNPSGGGGAGDASASNQSLQIGRADTTNAVLKRGLSLSPNAAQESGGNLDQIVGKLTTQIASLANILTQLQAPLPTLSNGTIGAVSMTGTTVTNFPATQTVANAVNIPISATITNSGFTVTLASPNVNATISNLTSAQTITPAMIISNPVQQSISSTSSVQWTVQGGGFYYMTIDNAPAVTSAFTATVVFETSPDNSAWTTVNGTPLIGLPNTLGPVGSTTTAGLYRIQVPTSAQYIRARVSSYTGGTVWVYLEPYGVANADIKIPYTPGINSGQTVSGWIDVSGMSEIGIRLSAVTTTVVTAQGTNDPTGADVQSINVLSDNSSNQTSAQTIAAAGTFSIINPVHKWVRFQITTTGTVLTVQGVSARFGQSIKLNGSQSTVGLGGTPGINVAQIAGTAAVNAGVAGTQAIGGNIAPGSARTLNPVTGGGTDVNNLIRTSQYDVDGTAINAGPGESVSQFSVGTGAAAVTDGTNGKTVFVLAKESDVYLSISAISTTPTLQLEGSYDGALWSVIPLSRYENTAASQQYSAQAAFTPVAGAKYRGKSYGYPMLRVHLVAGTTSNTIGILRVVPIQDAGNVTESGFALNAASTTEAVGSANGQVQAGGVRTLAIPVKGANKAILQIDGITGPGINYALEAGTDGTNFTAISMIPLAGGATVTSMSQTGTSALPAFGTFEADLTNYTYVRVHCTTYTSGAIFGALKIVNIPVATGNGTSTKASYVVNIQGATPTSANYVLGIIEAAAGKKVYINKITIWNPGSITSAQKTNYSLVRQTAAGSGTTATPTAKETTDAFGGIYRIAGSTNGSAGTNVFQFSLYTPTTLAAFQPLVYDFTNNGTMKGIVISSGTANGIYLRADNGAAGAANVDMTIEFTEQ